MESKKSLMKDTAKKEEIDKIMNVKEIDIETLTENMRNNEKIRTEMQIALDVSTLIIKN